MEYIEHYLERKEKGKKEKEENYNNFNGLEKYNLYNYTASTACISRIYAYIHVCDHMYNIILSSEFSLLMWGLRNDTRTALDSVIVVCGMYGVTAQQGTV